METYSQIYLHYTSEVFLINIYVSKFSFTSLNYKYLHSQLKQLKKENRLQNNILQKWKRKEKFVKDFNKTNANQNYSVTHFQQKVNIPCQ